MFGKLISECVRLYHGSFFFYYVIFFLDLFFEFLQFLFFQIASALPMNKLLISDDMQIDHRISLNSDIDSRFKWRADVRTFT